MPLTKKAAIQAVLFWVAVVIVLTLVYQHMRR